MKRHVAERRQKGWILDKDQSKSFATLDDVLIHMKETYGDFKILNVTFWHQHEIRVIFQTKEE